MFQMLRKWITLSLIAVTLGCGGTDGPKLVPVHGTITLDGQPLDRASITFHPEGGRPSVGLSDAKGYYELQYSYDRAGAMSGHHLVTITTEVMPSRTEDMPKDAPTLPGRKELLPKRYRENSELTVDVKPGQKVYDFALNSSPDTAEKPGTNSR